MISRSVYAVASCILAAVIWLSGPLLTREAIAEERITLVATTGMIADTARRVGGDLVEVTMLMGPGVDPHAYRQTRTDIVALVRADLVLWHGLYLEAQMEDFMLDLAEEQTVIAVGESVPTELLRAHDDYDGRFDPHVWMDPMLWAYVVDDIASSLAELAPMHAETFRSNATDYTSELEALSQYAIETTSSVPEASRVLLTAHDAFGYFSSAYGFDVIGIQGISTEGEAGLNRISELVELIVERDIAAVFVETSVSDRNMRALIEGAAAKGHEVTIGGELFSDAMGEEGTYVGTYLGMMDHNLTIITRALGGEAPETGRIGELAAGS